MGLRFLSRGWQAVVGLGRLRRRHWPLAGEKGKLATIKLAKDERVVSIEAGCDPGGGMRKLAIRTNKGRYPDAGFFGRAGSASVVKSIRAPRVVGFHGFKATLVHCIGLCYLRLSDDAVSPEFLTAIEPELLRSREYGIIGAR